MVDFLQRPSEKLVRVQEGDPIQPLEFERKDIWWCQYTGMMMAAGNLLSKNKMPSFDLVKIWPVSSSPASVVTLLRPVGSGAAAYRGRKLLTV